MKTALFMKRERQPLNAVVPHNVS